MAYIAKKEEGKMKICEICKSKKTKYEYKDEQDKNPVYLCQNCYKKHGETIEDENGDIIYHVEKKD